MKALIINIDRSAPIPGVERLIPPAKTGNLKDPAKIQAKIQEHTDRCLSEASDNSLLGQPRGVSCCTIDLPDPQQQCLTGPSGRTVVGEVLEFDLPEHLQELHSFLTGLTDVQLLLGVHPTTHVRRLQNEMIRQKLSVPACFGRRVERLNVFQELCTAAEGEYPDCLLPLGLQPSTSVDDVLVVAQRLNIF